MTAIVTLTVAWYFSRQEDRTSFNVGAYKFDKLHIHEQGYGEAQDRRNLRARDSADWVVLIVIRK